ncbi:hypothetical protein SCP_0303530 [Sparassis crispa]|uniref:Uncharacterized protein n=1 Tax=Sparassis crispa TaxID=139825 RepID=A0A401GEN3_9APHY|nr:hypothetical protein SCP_0303530 [Sparassis crispa]GBE80636.1 hypothetical protein SCP_0303530 [Sparassis crispa]
MQQYDMYAWKTTRKANTCSRCKVIMYPGPEGSDINHKRSFCSDGVRQKPKKLEMLVDGKIVKSVEDVPAWPQPSGIFSTGTHFNPHVFLATIRTMYEDLVVKRSTGGEHSMEYVAFAALLEKRTVVDVDPESEPGGRMVLFELFKSLVVAPSSADLIVERGGIKYMRLDCLHESVSKADADGGDRCNSSDSEPTAQA